jgi:outer membrane protein OmpA-like peptidoglycan-associated protein/flagellar hook assembly protein FlgD
LDWKIELVSDKDAVFRTWAGSTARLDALPAAIVFDGRSVDGDTIPDGVYRFRARLRYENGNEPYAVAPPVVVDTRKPEGRVRASSNLMALGRAAGLTFYHDLSRNAQWRGVVSDASGARVRALSIAKGGEGEVYWNGLDDAGNPVADGSYRYHAEGRSFTGISGRTAEAPFRVESGGAAVSLMADRKEFSPSLARSAVRILPRLEKRERAISYSLEIAPAAGATPVRRFAGVSVPPSSFVWDGRDEADRIIPDGDYRISLTVRYETGGETAAEPVFVAVDGTPPSAKVAASGALFSPNGDGVLDSISIAQSAGPEEAWFAEIVDEKGAPVLFRELGPTVPASFVWDGTTVHGDIAPDGSYRYRLSAVDRAGNEASFLSAPFTLDARKPTATLSTDKYAFSPNGDGFADALKLNLVPSFSDGLRSVSVRIVDGAGTEVHRLPDGPFRSEYGWDGAGSDGKRVPDGVYKAVAVLSYFKGDTVAAESPPVRVDATPPSLAIALSPLPFSPDDDGENDELSLALTASDAGELAGWSLSILDPEGYPFVSFSGREMPTAPLVWDGTDPDGNLVEAAQDYSYVYLVRDQLGNIAKAEGKIPVDVFVLRDGDRLKIRVSSINFAPNSASLQLVDPVLTERNRTVLDRIAAVLGKFPTYRIRVEGHAVNLSGTEREERTELLPLSAARAKTVSDALVSRGIASERLEAVGLGGREPVVPHGDAQARWRNRRVEFVLVR